jgi:hypothetical protein
MGYLGSPRRAAVKATGIDGWGGRIENVEWEGDDEALLGARVVQSMSADGVERVGCGVACSGRGWQNG